MEIVKFVGFVGYVFYYGQLKLKKLAENIKYILWQKEQTSPF